MMQLDIANGNLTIGNLNISPSLSTSKLESLVEKDNIKKVVQNKQFTTYSISEMNNEEFALSLFFSGGKLTSISIELGKRYNFPPFVITSEEKRLLEYQLSQIGGANIYRWGNVKIVEDSKGGSISIVIKYI